MAYSGHSRYLLRLAEASGGEREAVEKYIVQQLECQGLQCEKVGGEAETCIVVSANPDLLAKQVSTSIGFRHDSV